MHSASNQGTPWLDRWGCASLGSQITSESERRKKRKQACRRWPRPGTAQSRASLHVCACTPHHASQPVSAHTASSHTGIVAVHPMWACACVAYPCLQHWSRSGWSRAKRQSGWLRVGCILVAYRLHVQPHRLLLFPPPPGRRPEWMCRPARWNFCLCALCPGPCNQRHGQGTRVHAYMRPRSYMVIHIPCPGLDAHPLAQIGTIQPYRTTPGRHGNQGTSVHQHNLVLGRISPRDQPEPVSREGKVAANGLAPTCPGQVVT